MISKENSDRLFNTLPTYKVQSLVDVKGSMNDLSHLKGSFSGRKKRHIICKKHQQHSELNNILGKIGKRNPIIDR